MKVDHVHINKSGLCTHHEYEKQKMYNNIPYPDMNVLNEEQVEWNPMTKQKKLEC